jgi:hypothetical protein
MNKGYLSDYFEGVGMKVLTRVDATKRSNQHEVGDGQHGQVLMRILGDQPRKGTNRFPARYIWLGDEQETITDEGFLSWYDTRENQPDRSPEWRLYYQSNPVTELMNEGDNLFVAKAHDGTLLFIVVPADSAIVGQVAWLFGIDIQRQFTGFAINELGDGDGDDTRMDFISRFILDEIGVEFEDPNANSLDTIIERYGNAFPSTIEFSNLARLTLPEVDARDDADRALMAWLNHEEALFRRLEKKIVAERVAQGFMDGDTVDVDGFIRYSLGVQNRRKARMGRSFENQLRAVFDTHDIKYDEQVITEKGKKPDFIFPGKAQYYDAGFQVELLTMLAAKSTCKDRWPQILPEAERLPQKHLATLEPAISVPQTDLMRNSGVQLIVPAELQSSYTDDQRAWLWKISDFLDLVKRRQQTALPD